MSASIKEFLKNAETFQSFLKDFVCYFYEQRYKTIHQNVHIAPTFQNYHNTPEGVMKGCRIFVIFFLFYSFDRTLNVRSTSRPIEVDGRCRGDKWPNWHPQALRSPFGILVKLSCLVVYSWSNVIIKIPHLGGHSISWFVRIEEPVQKYLV